MNGKFEKRLLTELAGKDYRDAFVESHIRTGVAYQIRAMRNARGWSQEDLAAGAETTQSAVARLENPDYGKFSLTTLLKLASAYDVALLVRFVRFSELLGRTRDLSPSGLDAESYGEDRMLRGYEKITFFAPEATEPNVVAQDIGFGLRWSPGAVEMPVLPRAVVTFDTEEDFNFDSTINFGNISTTALPLQ